MIGWQSCANNSSAVLNQYGDCAQWEGGAISLRLIGSRNGGGRGYGVFSLINAHNKLLGTKRGMMCGQGKAETK